MSTNYDLDADMAACEAREKRFQARRKKLAAMQPPTEPQAAERRFKEGDKVLFQGQTYDFGYHGNNGRCVLYKEGERNMQDSISVPLYNVTPSPTSLRVHTATPWNVRGLNEKGAAVIGGPHQATVADVYEFSSDRAYATAEHIVHCVNQHDQLVAALRDCVEALSRLPDVDGAYRQTCLKQARAALAHEQEGGE